MPVNFIVSDDFAVNADQYQQGVPKVGDKNFDLLYEKTADLNDTILSHIIFEFAADGGHSTQPKTGVTTSTDDFDTDFVALFGTGMSLTKMNGTTGTGEATADSAPTLVPGTSALRWQQDVEAASYTNDNKTEENICRDATAVANFGNPMLQQFSQSSITNADADKLSAAVKATFDLAGDDESAGQWVTKLALEAFSSADVDGSPDDPATHGRMKACDGAGANRTVSSTDASGGAGLYKFNLQAGDSVYFKFKITCLAMQAADGNNTAPNIGPSFTGADGNAGEICAVVKLTQS